jgi:cell division protein ZipA
MSTLRGILIGFAVLLLAAIYWWGRRADRKRRAEVAAQLAPAAAEAGAQSALPSAVAQDPAPARLEPTFSEPDDLPEMAEVAASDTAAHAPRAPATKIIALRLVATTPRFSGAHLRTALENEALGFGKYQIFHRTTPEGGLVFSVASMLEPGTFDLEHMFDEQYPGIALFAQLPAALDGMSVLGDLISCARKLQQTLGGVLQDDQGTPLLALRIEQLRREVRDFEAAASRSRSEPSHP